MNKMSNKDDAISHLDSAERRITKEFKDQDVARAQVYATLAVAEQLERIEELLEVLAGVTRKDK